MSSPSVRTLQGRERIFSFLIETRSFRSSEPGYISEVQVAQSPGKLSPSLSDEPWTRELGFPSSLITFKIDFKVGHTGSRYGRGVGIVRLKEDKDGDWKCFSMMLKLDSERMEGPLKIPVYGTFGKGCKSMSFGEEIIWRHNHPFDIERNAYRHLCETSPVAIISE